MVSHITTVRATSFLLLTSLVFQLCDAESIASRESRRLRRSADASIMPDSNCTVAVGEESLMELECNQKDGGEVFSKCLWVKSTEAGQGHCSVFSAIRLARPGALTGFSNTTCMEAHRFLCPPSTQRCRWDVRWNSTSDQCVDASRFGVARSASNPADRVWSLPRIIVVTVAASLWVLLIIFAAFTLRKWRANQIR